MANYKNPSKAETLFLVTIIILHYMKSTIIACVLKVIDMKVINIVIIVSLILINTIFDSLNKRNFLFRYPLYTIYCQLYFYFSKHVS